MSNESNKSDWVSIQKVCLHFLIQKNMLMPVCLKTLWFLSSNSKVDRQSLDLATILLPACYKVPPSSMFHLCSLHPLSCTSPQEWSLGNRKVRSLNKLCYQPHHILQYNIPTSYKYGFITLNSGISKREKDIPSW